MSDERQITCQYNHGPYIAWDIFIPKILTRDPVLFFEILLMCVSSSTSIPEALLPTNDNQVLRLS